MTIAKVLSTKVEVGDWLMREGVVRCGAFPVQAMAEVPVIARQVAKRSALVWR